MSTDYQSIAEHEVSEEFINVMQAKADRVDHVFIKHMYDAMVMSWFKYGDVGPQASSMAMTQIEYEQKAFDQDHNTEHMVNIANYAMIRYMFPQGDDPEHLFNIAIGAMARYSDGHYSGTDSDKSTHVYTVTQWLHMDLEKSLTGLLFDPKTNVD